MRDSLAYPPANAETPSDKSIMSDNENVADLPTDLEMVMHA